MKYFIDARYDGGDPWDPWKPTDIDFLVCLVEAEAEEDLGRIFTENVYNWDEYFSGYFKKALEGEKFGDEEIFECLSIKKVTDEEWEVLKKFVEIIS